MNSLGLIITAYEESRKPGLLERAMDGAKHPAFVELVVVDDGSSDSHITEARVKEWEDKNYRNTLGVKFVRNPKNLGVFGAKLTAIREATAEWVQSIDSDNYFGDAYVETLLNAHPSPWLMLSPSFAMPNFDYRQMQGKRLNMKTIKEFMSWKTFGCFINTGNQCFHRETMRQATVHCRPENNQLLQPDYFGLGDARAELKWRKVYDSADSFYFNMQWLGILSNEIAVVPGLHYQHDVHEHSSWAAAPPEKEVLPLLYQQELIDFVEKASSPYRFQYRFEKFERLGPRRCAVCVRTAPGQPTKRVWIDQHSNVVRKLTAL